MNNIPSACALMPAYLSTFGCKPSTWLLCLEHMSVLSRDSRLFNSRGSSILLASIVLQIIKFVLTPHTLICNGEAQCLPCAQKCPHPRVFRVQRSLSANTDTNLLAVERNKWRNTRGAF